MIKKIFMKNCATYNEQGASLDNCKKINFIYGANGSGKSTIGNYLMYQERSEYKDCELVWDSTTQPEIYVYNREFRYKHFRASDSIQGVFTLGKATIEEKEELELRKNERKEKQKDYDIKCKSIEKKKAELQERENGFTKDAWKHILKKYEKEFEQAFNGLRNSKSKFIEELKKRIEEDKGELREYEELKKQGRDIVCFKIRKMSAS